MRSRKGDVMTKHPPETLNTAMPTDKSDPDDFVVEVLNPRYKGATPEMVMRALIRNLKPPPSEEGK